MPRIAVSPSARASSTPRCTRLDDMITPVDRSLPKTSDGLGDGTRAGRLGAQRVFAAFSGQRRLAAAGRVIQLEAVEFLLARRGDRQVGVAPPVRRSQHLRQNPLGAAVDLPVSR